MEGLQTLSMKSFVKSVLDRLHVKMYSQAHCTYHWCTQVSSLTQRIVSRLTGLHYWSDNIDIFWSRTDQSAIHFRKSQMSVSRDYYSTVGVLLKWFPWTAKIWIKNPDNMGI